MPTVPTRLAQAAADGETWRLLGMPDGRLVLQVDGPGRFGEVELSIQRAGPLGRALTQGQRLGFDMPLPAEVATVIGRALIEMATRLDT